MGIICLEGASAVGKTTTANAMAINTNTYVIPEVNLLFERPKFASNTWYLERQVERWQIAQEKLKEYDTVILDGDIFQPLSYNWCFDFKVFNQSLDMIFDFYLKEIVAGRLNFPDKYFYLYTDQENLKYRKENDHTRNRGMFEKHLKIVEPHQRYYESLNQFVPNYIHTIETTRTEVVLERINDNLPTFSVIENPQELLHNILNWLKNNKA